MRAHIARSSLRPQHEAGIDRPAVRAESPRCAFFCKTIISNTVCDISTGYKLVPLMALTTFDAHLCHGVNETRGVGFGPNRTLSVE